MEITVVVPVYGCRAALMELYRRIKDTIGRISDEHEIIFVDDCCPQDSWEVIVEICGMDKKVKGIQMSRNFGQMKAITAGLDASRGNWVVVMDCDLQDSPEDIANLYKKAQEGYDIVFSRRKERQDNKLKIWISGLFYKLYSWAADDCFDPAMSNYCIMKRIVVDNFCKMREYHRAFTMYLKWLGFHTATIDVNHSTRKEGKSSYTMKKRIGLAMDIILSQSDKILKLIVGMGMLVSGLAFLTVILLIIQYFTMDIEPGWTSIVATTCLIGGLLMTAVGCVGIYVGNIFMQTKQRPLYVVRETINE
ncbi:glycosyltransferase [bacterium C-53]|nr:glycosyltransferase [Lachnospiraceae bacterium]NBI01626.1 glycosyltransferase [Lachnospiraceae bacterium]RKJ12920.1 glycosyltransferase [bacterium C-53]